MRKTLWTIRLGVLPLLAAGVWAAPQQTPVFRSAVDLVTVDATVVDSRGRPIEGLTADDFRLQVDGEPREIVSIQFVSRGSRDESVTAPGARLQGIDTSSNTAISESRLILVAVDQANIRRLEGRATLRAAADFIDSLDPRDRVAVAAVNYSGDLDFHTDRYRSRIDLERLTGEQDPEFSQFRSNLGLTEALFIADGSKVRLDQAVRRECGRQRLMGAPTRADEGGLEGLRDPCPIQVEQDARVMAQIARIRSNLTMSALLDLIARLSTIDGPKTMVLLSEGLVAEPHMGDLTVLGAAAQYARVTIYVLQLDVPLFSVTDERVSPTLIEDVQLRGDGLARLAGSARGALFQQIGGDSEPFQRILREQSGYYLLAFEPTVTERDGQAHQIRVSLAQGGGTLRSRTAFRLEPVASARRRTEERIVDLLRSETVAGDLPVRAASYTFYDPVSGQVRLVISGETDAPAGAASEVMFGYVLLDGQGVIVASQALETTSSRFLSDATVPPGVYTLKVAAIDRFGRAGSVPRAVLAGIADTEIPTSELVVSRAGGRPDDPLDPILEMTTADRVLAYVELYPDPGRSLRDVDVMISIRPAEGGPALLSRPAALASLGAVATARLTLPIADLQTGRYLVRAEVTDGGRVIGFVERAFTAVR